MFTPDKGAEAARVQRLEAACNQTRPECHPDVHRPRDALKLLCPKILQLEQIPEQLSCAVSDDDRVRLGNPLQTRRKVGCLADDAPLPDDVAVLISAARFLADPEAILRRPGKTGVIWPNNRDVDDLVPHLDRLAAVALVFPTFRDGRAYSQARLLRERYHYRGELRATGQVLRDQFVFMLRAGFDAFEVKKQADAEAFAQTVKRYSVFYQPTGDGRLTALHRRMQLRHSESAGL